MKKGGSCSSTASFKEEPDLRLIGKSEFCQLPFADLSEFNSGLAKTGVGVEKVVAQGRF